MEIDELTGIVVDKCIQIHSRIGPGCFERVYEEILCHELCEMGLTVQRQILLPISYDDLYIKDAYKLDLLIDNRLILELKTVHPIHPVFFKQVRTYLALTNLKYDMLLNFKVNLMKDGIHRVFNNAGRPSL